MGEPDRGARDEGRPPTVREALGDTAPYRRSTSALMLFGAAMLWVIFGLLWAAGTYPAMLGAPILLYFGTHVASVVLPVAILNEDTVVPRWYLEGMDVWCAFLPALWVGAAAAPAPSLALLGLIAMAAQTLAALTAADMDAAEDPVRSSRKRVPAQMSVWLLRALA